MKANPGPPEKGTLEGKARPFINTIIVHFGVCAPLEGRESPLLSPSMSSPQPMRPVGWDHRCQERTKSPRTPVNACFITILSEAGPGTWFW